jgi:hypothetical protein
VKNRRGQSRFLFKWKELQVDKTQVQCSQRREVRNGSGGRLALLEVFVPWDWKSQHFSILIAIASEESHDRSGDVCPRKLQYSRTRSAFAFLVVFQNQNKFNSIWNGTTGVGLKRYAR